MTNAVVVDTNIIFSALVSKESKIREVLLESNLILYAPNYLISEIYSLKDKLFLASQLTESEFYILFNGIIECVRFVPVEFIRDEIRQKAYDLCKNIDVKDTPFIALALELEIPVWTGDRKLKEGLAKKGFHFLIREVFLPEVFVDSFVHLLPK